MAFSLEQLLELRPYLYHLTAASNVPRILARGSLESAEDLLVAGGRPELVSDRRVAAVDLSIAGERVHVRDQKPLFEGNMHLDEGWTFDGFVAHLNRYVFFWPGDEKGPIDSGLRHWGRYEEERPRMLRLNSSILLAPQNRGRVRVCRFNSGSPRWTRGRPSPRGSRTFVRPDDADFTPGSTVEIVVEGPVELGAEVWTGASPSGPWVIAGSPAVEGPAAQLSTKRKGDIAELHVTSLLLSDPALEVFTAASDDGHGSDLAVRSSRTGRWYSVQVKAAGPTVNPFVYLDRFRGEEDFIVAVVVLDERGLPQATYLVPAPAWAQDTSGALGRNEGGGESGPYVEVRTMAPRYRDALAAYESSRMLGTL